MTTQGVLVKPRQPYLPYELMGDLVARWAAALNVPAPAIRRIRHGGSYSPFFERINAGPDLTYDNLLHEFAHHLTQMAIAPALRGQRTGGRRNPHGRSFFDHLVRVILADGTRPLTDYDWRREYRTVYKFAVRAGYVEADLAFLRERDEQRERMVARHRRGPAGLWGIRP